MDRLVVVIDRTRWHRGQGARHSALQIAADDKVAPGMRCCLGFACLAAGYSEEQIVGKGLPHRMHSDLRPLPRWFQDEGAMAELSHDNDNPTLVEAAREERLITEAARVGMDFIFIN